MALRLAMLNSSKGSKGYGSFSISRLTHSIAMPSPTDVLLSPTTKSPQCVLPESDQISSSESNGAGLGFPCSPFSGGSMELMAVPRKKLSQTPFDYDVEKITMEYHKLFGKGDDLKFFSPLNLQTPFVNAMYSLIQWPTKL